MPSVYFIYCTAADKFFVGETDNIIQRMGQHNKNISTGNKSEYRDLVQDYQKYGLETFVWGVFYNGPLAANAQSRRTLETNFFAFLGKGRLYNQRPLEDFLMTPEGRELVDEDYIPLEKSFPLDLVRKTFKTQADLARYFEISPGSIFSRKLLKRLQQKYIQGFFSMNYFFS